MKKTEYAKDIKCVALGSRTNLCTNRRVNKKGRDSSKLNDKCMEMQRDKTADGYNKDRGSSCPYYDKGEQSLFIDHALVKVRIASYERFISFLFSLFY